MVPRDSLPPSPPDATSTSPATVPDAPPPSGASAARGIGTYVGPYFCLDVLGEGGMGVVYKAHDPRLDRLVALKLLRVRSSERDVVGARDRLLREAQALARVSHPNVIGIYDVGALDDRVYVAMELAAGTTLRRWITSAERPTRAIVEAFVAAGRGLAAVHDAGLVHRDFKPDNVLVGDDGRVRLLDFGLVRRAERDGGGEGAFGAGPRSAPPGARAPSGAPAPTDADLATERALSEPVVSEPIVSEAIVSEAKLGGDVVSSGGLLAAVLTKDGRILGTPRYMAPEQHDGVVDARTDQFSFCVALYEALYREHPFPHGSRQELRRATGAGAVAPPPAGHRVPSAVRKVLLRGLSPNPAHRYATMTALLDELAADPYRRHKRALGLAAAVTLAVLATFAVRLVVEKPPLCAGANAKLAGVWDNERRQRVEAAFQATGKAYAAPAFAAVAKELDARASAWATMFREACEATRVRGEQSEELLDLRMECLEGRLAELRAQTHAFASADGETVRRAVVAVERLGDLSACADARALRDTSRAPSEDPALRRAIEAARTRVAEGRALLRAGKYERALGVTKPLLEEARRLGHKPLVAEVAFLDAQIEDAAGHFEEADARYREAVRAAEAGRADALAAEAATALVWATAELGGKLEQALALSLDAEAKVERLGKEGEAARAHWLGVVASALYRLGRFDEAEAKVREALGTFARLRGEASDDYLQHLNTLGNVQHGSGRYEEARATYARIVDTRVKKHGEAHPLVASALINLGNGLAQMGRRSEAIASFRRSLAVLEAEHGPDDPELGYVLTSLGVELHEQGNDVEALAQHRRALALWEPTLGPEHAGVGVVHYNLGEVHRGLGQVAEAERELSLALAIETKAVGPEHPYVATAHAGLGRLHADAGKPAKALPHLERAVELYAKAGGAGEVDLVPTAAALGQVYLALRRPREAAGAFERAITAKLARDGASADVAELRFSLAQALYRGGDRDAAFGAAELSRAGFRSTGRASGEAQVSEWVAHPR